ncbi:MAG: alpha/beta hydrolase [Cyanobacteria bacterium P01_A01_bin.123]
MTLPVRNSRIRLSQGTLFWREVGHGNPTLVLLHGTWSDSSQWLPLMTQLGQDFHCLAPDLLGFGESSQSLTLPYSITLEVECLAEYLEALRSQSVYFIADALGAWVATSYALRYPERVQGLVLIAPEGVSPPTLVGRWSLHRLLAGRFSIVAWTIRVIAPVARGLGQAKWVARSQHLRRQLLAFPAACRLLFKRRQVELQGERLDGQLPYLNTPLWLLRGEQDQVEAQTLREVYAAAAHQGIVVEIAANLNQLETATEALALAITPLIKQTIKA